tara:strand:- start:57 stop:338 length:282 start_codon:yes stop_codon:yes gene_type:complete
MTEKNIYQKLYKNMEEYEKALKLDKEKYLAKIKLEAKVEKEMREILEGEIYNNETMYLMSQKLIPVLAQLPQEPILNKYIGGYIDRCKKYLIN